jgi:hypothetical protein
LYGENWSKDEAKCCIAPNSANLSQKNVVAEAQSFACIRSSGPVNRDQAYCKPLRACRNFALAAIQFNIGKLVDEMTTCLATSDDPWSKWRNIKDLTMTQLKDLVEGNCIACSMVIISLAYAAYAKFSTPPSTVRISIWCRT